MNKQRSTANGVPYSLRGRLLTYRPELDGLRAIAIMLVLYAHAQLPGPGWGFLGVDIFFVLSGYLITQLLLKGPHTAAGLRGFYRRRFARLVPALVAMVAIVTVVRAIAGSPLPVWAPIAAITNTMNLVGFWTNDNQANPLTPTWSLASEEQFYIIWPLLLFVAVKFMTRRTLAALALLWFGAVLVVQHFAFGHLPLDVVLHGPFFRPAGLLLGCAIALVPGVQTRAAKGLLIASPLLFALATLQGNGLYASMAAASFLLFLNAAPSSRTSIALASKPLAALGRLSYGLYLWNVPCVTAVIALLGDSIAAHLLGTIATFIAAWLSFKLLELPAMRALAGNNSHRQ